MINDFILLIVDANIIIIITYRVSCTPYIPSEPLFLSINKESFIYMTINLNLSPEPLRLILRINLSVIILISSIQTMYLFVFKWVIEFNVVIFYNFFNIKRTHFFPGICFYLTSLIWLTGKHLLQFAHVIENGLF